jgi:hypothetical protein
MITQRVTVPRRNLTNTATPVSNSGWAKVGDMRLQHWMRCLHAMVLHSACSAANLRFDCGDRGDSGIALVALPARPRLLFRWKEVKSAAKPLQCIRARDWIDEGCAASSLLSTAEMAAGRVLAIAALAAHLQAASAALGFDIPGPISPSTATCMVNGGYSFAIIRQVWQSSCVQ